MKVKSLPEANVGVERPGMKLIRTQKNEVEDLDSQTKGGAEKEPLGSNRTVIAYGHQNLS